MAEISDSFLNALIVCADCDRESKAKKGSDGAYYMRYLSWYNVDGKESESDDSEKPALDIHLHIRVGKENWITEAIEIEQQEWNVDNNHVSKTYALRRIAILNPKIKKFIDDECEKTDFAFFDHPNCERYS